MIRSESGFMTSRDFFALFSSRKLTPWQWKLSPHVYFEGDQSFIHPFQFLTEIQDFIRLTNYEYNEKFQFWE